MDTRLHVVPLALLVVSAPLLAQDPSAELLPPALHWSGASRRLAVADDDPWITPAEKTGFAETPRHAETMAWLRRLATASPEIEIVTLGTSAEGRPIELVIASADGAFTPGALRASPKPVLFAHGGIHAGEIDGKDAGMMLLRDLTVRGTQRELLAGAHFLFVPVLNVDGHERFSAFGRINQRGPREIGWRTDANNLNLNRDFTKLDTAGVRAVVAVLNAYEPELYLDLHVTDGLDYQYDVTFGWVGPHGFSPQIAAWLDLTLGPALARDLHAAGHVPGPLVFPANGVDASGGIVEWMGSPRFSSTYGDVRHVPTVLVENHSLKPYDQRVLGTYVLLESALRTLAREHAALTRAIAADRARRPGELPIEWRAGAAPGTLEFLGIASEKYTSPVSGAEAVRWLGRPETQRVPHIRMNVPARSVRRPKAYWIPAAWGDVIARLELHGIAVERLTAPREVSVQMDRLRSHELAREPFEGRVRITAKLEHEVRREHFPAGSVRVPTDQPLGDLAVLLLEPDSEDSFFQWGFFHPILQLTEYAEPYVLEPLAERMLAQDPELRAEFERALEDPELAQSPGARLAWFYRRSPWYDERNLLYPVGRELE
jgi:hypothetical protein